MKKLRWYDRLVQGLNWVAALFLFLACLSPYINVQRPPLFAFLALVVPLLFFANLILVLYWMMRRSIFIMVPIAALLLSLFIHGSFFELNRNSEENQDEDINILSFNTRAFNRWDWIDRPEIGEKIVTFIKSTDADIACFQEFDQNKAGELDFYPHSFVHYDPGGPARAVQAIFSKFPIVNKGSLEFEDSPNNAIYADINIGSDTIRVYNFHLESLKVRPDVDALSDEDSGKLLSRMSRTLGKQQEQALLLRSDAEGNTFPKILCGDMNNTQFSRAYHILKSDYQDAFKMAGTGFGATHTFPYFPLRIDFIFTDNSFQVLEYKNFQEELSDHYPVWVTLSRTGN